MTVDFSKLGKDLPLALYTDEETALRNCPRCPSCSRLGVFHIWIMAPELGKRFLVCTLLPDQNACAEEILIDD